MADRTRSGLLGRLASRRGRGVPRAGPDSGDAEVAAGASAAAGSSVAPGAAGAPTTPTSAPPAAADPATPATRERPPGAGSGLGAPATRAASARVPERDPVPDPEPAAMPGAAARAGVADPAPLGLAALALTILVLSLFTSGLLSGAGQPVVLGLAFAYGGLAQLLAGMWAFRTPNTFAATAFSSYGAFWLFFALLSTFFATRIPAGELGVYLGWMLLAWALFTTGMYAVSVKLTGRVNVVFLLLGATLYLLGVGETAGVEMVIQVGGYVGIVTALAAGFAAFATIVDRGFAQRVLPVGEIERQARS